MFQPVMSLGAAVWAVFQPVVLLGSHIWYPRPLRWMSLHLAYLSKLSLWMKEHPSPVYLADRYQLYSRLIESEGLDAPIDFLEFGVFQGNSLKYWLEKVRHPEARFVGFDCFEGLPEHFHRRDPKGKFDTGGKPPEIDDARCSFEIGLFAETLPKFLEREPLERRKVVHLDADLYSSTLYVLTMLGTRLRAGDVLIFDEFGRVLVAVHEFKAFDDFCAAYPISVEVLGATKSRGRLAMKVV